MSTRLDSGDTYLRFDGDSYIDKVATGIFQIGIQAATDVRIGGGYIDLFEISAPANPASNSGRIYVADDGGTTKLYFKDSAGTSTDLLASGGGSPGGSNTQVQFNSSSSFGGDAGFTYDSAKDYLRVGATASPVFNGTTYSFGLELAHTASGSDLGGIVMEVAAGTSRLRMIRANGTIGSKTTVVDNDVCGQLYFAGHDGTDYQTAAMIQGTINGTPATDVMPMDLDFYTRNTTGSVAKNMTLSRSGNLGVGTDSPGAKIEAFSTSAQYIQVRCESDTATSKPMFRAIHQRTSAAPASQNNDHLGGMIISGHNGTGIQDAWHCYAIATTNFTTTNVRSQMHFTARNDTTWTTGLKLNYDGKIYGGVMYSGYTISGTNKDLYIDSSGLIGVISSSERFKQNIIDMEDTSWLHDLNPVNFEYKTDPGIKCWGLIAEDVVKICPELVTYDEDGLVDGVTYSKLIPILLNEIKNLKIRLDKTESTESQLVAVSK